MNDENSRVLKTVDEASSAGAALDAIPDTWPVFLVGPDETMRYSCSIQPPGIPVAKRIYERGLAMGTGRTRLEAMRAATAWIRARTPAMAA
jgi:hypothetical protein